jgi:hypothetical protein
MNFRLILLNGWCSFFKFLPADTKSRQKNKTVARREQLPENIFYVKQKIFLRVRDLV